MGIIKHNGTYSIDYYVRDAGGALKRKREKVGSNHKLAKELLTKRQAEVNEQKFFPERHEVRVRFADAAKSFLEWARVNISVRGHERYKCSMASLTAVFGERFLDQITPVDVERYKADRIQHVEPGTINRDLMVLKRLYNLILKGRLLPDTKIVESLPTRIALMRENNKRLRYLSGKEYGQILLACERLNQKRRRCLGTRVLDMKSIIITAVHTGMRRNEILGLKWCDVDLSGRVITIHEGKGGSSRHVPINSLLARALERIPRHIESPYLFYHREKGESAGHRFTELKRAWQALLKEASIDNLRFHDLRHTCASWLVMKGVPLQTVQQILGHKSFVTTLRYAHMAPELRNEAAERLCEVADGHFLDTSTRGGEGGHLRPAANDGVSKGFGESGGIRTHGPRLKKPLLYR
jgi:integrase